MWNQTNAPQNNRMNKNNTKTLQTKTKEMKHNKTKQKSNIDLSKQKEANKQNKT